VIARAGAGTIEVMKILIGGAVCLALVAAPLACDDTTSCTLQGCGSTLELFIEVAGGGELPDASYEVVLELDGETYVTACGRPEPDMFVCEPVEGTGSFEVDASPFTDRTAISLHVMADEGEGEGPEVVHLTVVSGDAPLIDRTMEPLYSTVFPNGEGCGSCVTAEPITSTFERP
jgi:hypothetical protein